MATAKFHDHKVTDKGLYIRGLSGPAMSPNVEIFVEREDAEQFGWIDPVDGVEDDATQDLQEQPDTIQRELEQLRKKNKHLLGTLDYVLDELESIAESHHNDMSPLPKKRVDELIAFIKAAAPASVPDEKPVTTGTTIPIVYIEEEPDDISEREQELKKLAEWNAISKQA